MVRLNMGLLKGSQRLQRRCTWTMWKKLKLKEDRKYRTDGRAHKHDRDDAFAQCHVPFQ